MKKLALIMLAVVSMALVSCGGGEMTPQTTKISGPLGEEFEVVDGPAKLQGDIWTVQLKSLKDYHSASEREPFGCDRVLKGKYEYYDHVGFGLETYDKDGALVAKRVATRGGLNGPYSSDDVMELMNLKEGETGFIRWKCEDSEKKVKGMTFKITSAQETVWNYK